MKYYFGYGSNMSVRQMQARCPDSVYLDKARLQGWQFVYNSDHVATIIPNPKTRVWGTVFQISEKDERLLDGFEVNYKKIEIEIAPFERVMTYIALNNTIGQPYDNYHRHIIASVKNRDIPSHYIEEEFLSWEQSGKLSSLDYINGE